MTTAVHSHPGCTLSTCGLSAGNQFPGVDLHGWPSTDFSPSVRSLCVPLTTQILECCRGDRGTLEARSGLRSLRGSQVSEPGWRQLCQLDQRALHPLHSCSHLWLHEKRCTKAVCLHCASKGKVYLTVPSLKPEMYNLCIIDFKYICKETMPDLCNLHLHTYTH